MENNETLFALIFTEIFLMPIMHNFDNIYDKLKKKIDLILFSNSEYISSMLIDLDSNEILCDIGNLFQKNYKSSFLQWKSQNNILKEIIFHGIHLKTNYIRSNDKSLDKKENSLKLELRATFPKPLFIIKFFPLLKGTAIVHYFSQYKLSKTQIRNPQNPNTYIYDYYKEIDIEFFNLFNFLEEKNFKQMKFVEAFFFEYFLILGNNIKENGNVSNLLMTYKSRDYNLIYLNKNILQLIKDIIIEYFKDENDLIYKLKKKLIEESDFNENNENKIIITNTNLNTNKNECSITKFDELNSNNNINNYKNYNIDKNPLEFSYTDFIKEFKTNLILKENKNDNRLIGLSDVNVMLPGDFSNVNEYSDLNLTKNNIEMIKRNIVTSYSGNNNELNIYSNDGMITTDYKNLKTELDNGGIPINTNDPFIIDVTSIENKGEISKDEWGFKSILSEKNKNKPK